MDCNKDDAIKAKEIAEKKMEIQDFEGAKKTVLKAKQLYPELDSIPQMLTICDVHCAAQVKVSSTEKDWYGILQVELAADEASIKKQYRKLALLLHPDKNKVAGAEAAFKLIGEAHRVLSDRAQRSLYDMRYKAMKERSKLPQQWKSTTHAAQKQPGVDNKFKNFIRPQYTTVNLHREQNQPGPERPTFWTQCPFCNVRFQYYRTELNRNLVCNSCKKHFVAFEYIQGVPSGAPSTQPTVSQPKKVSQNAPKVQPRSSARDFSSNVVDQGRCDRKTAATEIFPAKPGTSKVNGDSETTAKENERVTGEDIKQNGKKPKFAGRKRRKSEEESSESCDTESSSEEFAIPEDTEGGAPVECNSRIPGGRDTRRSARQKRQVVYNEDSDDDTVGSRRASRPSTVVGDQKKEEASKTTKADGISADIKKDKEVEEQQENVPSEGSSPNGNAKVEPCNGTGKEAVVVEDNREKTNADDPIELSPRDKNLPEPEFIEVVDPEFYVFDNDRKEDSFKFDQMWAVYDDTDCMPRFYARIRKILSPGFKVRITWLEADPDDEDEIEWFNEGLPVSCGKYKLGKTEITEDMNMFSHLVTWTKGPSRGSLLVYPKKGETWALFKNWDIKWSSDEENHGTYEYDFVEVLSDYDQGSGISVANLEKVKGFVSLFCQKKGVASIQIPPKELYRFSHMVPSYRTKGSEREGVSEGSFELDPASLPASLVDPKHM